METTVSIACGLSLFWTCFFSMLVINAFPSGDAVEEHSSKGRWRSSCESVAEAAGLSARETEVFMLLAKGRGIEHIQNKLCISSHTVKTHTYNIYRKMGIGSREELLDAIEAVGGSEDDR